MTRHDRRHLPPLDERARLREQLTAHEAYIGSSAVSLAEVEIQESGKSEGGNDD